jgi:hypothetical protein
VADGPVVARKPGNAGGAKGPWFRTNARRSRRAERLVMSLRTLLKVQRLQAALHAKAKGSPSYRFYAYRANRSALEAVGKVYSMRRFVLGWKTLGHERRLRAYIVNYADDFVICCRGTATQAMVAMREMMQRLRLTVNEHKTRQCRAWDETHGRQAATVVVP